jgi:RNA ligase
MALITRTEAEELIKNNEVFYKNVRKIEDTEITMFSYRLATANDFANNIKSLEMRGLTFIGDSNKPILHLHKFFNDKENDFTQKEWDGKVYCYDKFDGSLLIPFELNGKVYWKTQMDIDNIQTNMATKIYNNNKSLQILVKGLLEKGLTPFFELTSPLNQIVVEYKDTTLKLIQVRDQNSGEYLPYEELQEMNRIFKVDIPNRFEVSYTELKEMQKNLRDVEGFIGVKEDEPFYVSYRKFKTDWYFRMHHAIASDNMLINNLAQLYLKNEIDDVLSLLSKDSIKRKIIIAVIEAVRNKMKEIKDEVEALYKDVIEKKMNMKEVALAHKNHPYFFLLVKRIQGNDNYFYKALVECMLKKTYRLKSAEEFLNISQSKILENII